MVVRIRPKSGTRILDAFSYRSRNVLDICFRPFWSVSRGACMALPEKPSVFPRPHTRSPRCTNRRRPQSLTPEFSCFFSPLDCCCVLCIWWSMMLWWVAVAHERQQRLRASCRRTLCDSMGIWRGNGGDFASSLRRGQSRREGSHPGPAGKQIDLPLRRVCCSPSNSCVTGAPCSCLACACHRCPCRLLHCCACRQLLLSQMSLLPLLSQAPDGPYFRQAAWPCGPIKGRPPPSAPCLLAPPPSPMKDHCNAHLDCCSVTSQWTGLLLIGITPIAWLPGPLTQVPRSVPFVLVCLSSWSPSGAGAPSFEEVSCSGVRLETGPSGFPRTVGVAAL